MDEAAELKAVKFGFEEAVKVHEKPKRHRPENSYTVGQKMADGVAKFGGSWTFVLLFCVVIFLWIMINTWFVISKDVFDPYPFILLNLGLSCLAAIQAPIIMMSQNRQAEKDRLMEENDYKVNQKAEREIKQIQEKLDQILHEIEQLKTPK